MRIGLFGKILLLYWMMLIVQGIVMMLLLGIDPFMDRPTSRVVPSMMTILQRTVERDGPRAAEAQRRLLFPSIADQITITPILPRATLKLQDGDIALQASAPNGDRYRVAYRRTSIKMISTVPRYVLIGTAISGMLFSIGLALYISRPLRLLRQGLERLAQGDLSVRLHERLGNRRDELTDVARDFDVTAARLGQLVTARDRLLNDVSHELRSPLTRLRLAIGLARQDKRRMEETLDRIESEAQKLDELVNELLSLARAESDVERSSDDFFDPAGVIEAVAKGIDLEADVNANKIVVDLGDPQDHASLVVAGDARLFYRAIENVLRNALRFSPQTGNVEIRIEVRASPARYVIAILDEGPGMDPAIMPTALEPFVRASKSGTGLGLSIADRALRAMGGTIRCSNRDGAGLAVNIELPALSLPA